jgi:hypothetical protein
MAEVRENGMRTEGQITPWAVNRIEEPFDARPQAYALECAAEPSGVERDGIHQWQEPNPYCSGDYWSSEQLSDSAFLGPWIGALDGRHEQARVRRYIQEQEQEN